MEPGRIENAAVSGCCFGMQDHLYGSGLLLKPASEGEKLASLRQSPLPVPTQKSEAARWLASRQRQPDTAVFSILFSFFPLHPTPAKLQVYCEINMAVNQLLSAEPYTESTAV